MKKLIKKLILALNIYNLNEVDRLNKMKEMATAHQANITVVPGLTPTPASVITLIDAQGLLYIKRDNLKEQLKQITEQIHKGDSAINDIFVDQWRGQVQLAIGGDLSLAKLLGWGAKTQDTGHTPVSVSTARIEMELSLPMISKIDVNVHNQHTLHIINNLTGKRRLPAGVLRVDVYGFTGAAGLVITDLSQIISNGGGYLGQAAKGKFVNTFTTTATGKTEYYVVVYVDKKTKKPLAQSPVLSAIIN